MSNLKGDGVCLYTGGFVGNQDLTVEHGFSLPLFYGLYSQRLFMIFDLIISPFCKCTYFSHGGCYFWMICFHYGFHFDAEKTDLQYML